MPISSLLQSIVDFVRAGYPEGVPERDYFPIFALLRRRLTDDEVAAVAFELVSTSPDPGASAAKVRQAIEAVTEQPASEADMARVQNRLAAVGWNLDGADQQRPVV
jgi:Protein of unknown function (DUF3349)